MRRTSILAPFLVAACGGKPAGPVEQPTLAAEPTTPAVAATESGGKNLPQPVIDAVGFSRLYVDDFKSLMLFADERLAAQQLIAAWGANNGLYVLPPETIEEAVTRGAAGQNADTGAACGPSLDRELALERWVDAAGAIKAAVYCDPTCFLQVELTLHGKGTEFFAAPYDTGRPWREELPRRLATVVDNGGHGQHGHANNPVEIAGIDRAEPDLVANEDAEIDLGGDGTAIATSCGMRGMMASLLVEPGASGGKTRCERYADPRYITETDPAIVQCACDAVVAKHTPKRREVVRLPSTGMLPDRVRTRSGLTAWAELIGGNEYRDAGVAWFIPGQIYANVATCFANRTAEGDGEISATIDFDPDGKVTKATLGDVAGKLKPGEADCLQAALRTLRTPCPADRNPTGVARIAWRISKPD
jgi:hypothetical protein